MCGAEVGVVIPTFNRPLQLTQAVRSVLSQTDVEIEVVIVDDGDSRGDLGRVVDDSRVRVAVTPRPGAGAAVARNAGLAVTTAPWVAFCDDDDLWHPAKLATQLGVANGAGWIACNSASFWVTRGGRPRIHAVSPPVSVEQIPARIRHHKGLPGGGSGVMIRTELLRAVGGYRDLPMAEDWDLWLRLLDRAPVAITPERVVAIRLHNRSVTTDVRRLRRGTDEVAALHGVSEHPESVRLDLAHDLRWYAEIAGRSGQRRLALSLQSDAARHSGCLRDWLRALGLFAAPRTLGRVRALRRRRALPAVERRAVERWVGDALRS